jgi:hypothetical protein
MTQASKYYGQATSESSQIIDPLKQCKLREIEHRELQKMDKIRIPEFRAVAF